MKVTLGNMQYVALFTCAKYVSRRWIVVEGSEAKGSSSQDMKAEPLEGGWNLWSR
jgi:hypothetical protein